MIRKILLAILATTCLTLTACGDFGQVVQGRTVAFDAEKRIVTFIKDSEGKTHETHNIPDFLLWCLPFQKTVMTQVPSLYLGYA